MSKVSGRGDHYRRRDLSGGRQDAKRNRRDAETSRKGEEPFRGFRIVFMGDFYQLPPVDIMPLYKRFEDKDPKNDPSNIDIACRTRREAWLSVNATFELDVNHRQRADTTGFIDLLRTIRTGRAPTPAQMNKLRARQCTLSEAFVLAGDTALWVTHRN